MEFVPKGLVKYQAKLSAEYIPALAFGRVTIKSLTAGLLIGAVAVSEPSASNVLLSGLPAGYLLLDNIYSVTHMGTARDIDDYNGTLILEMTYKVARTVKRLI